MFAVAETRSSRTISRAEDRHLRLAAEFDNYRKRSSRERAELSDRAQASFVAKLLDVLDDLERLVASDPDTRRGRARGAQRGRSEAVEGAAGGRRGADGPGRRAFDPARSTRRSPTSRHPIRRQDHTVSATFQPGYRFKGTLVRPARVQVYADQGQH